jgi:hypothetical protein
VSYGTLRTIARCGKLAIGLAVRKAGVGRPGIGESRLRFVRSMSLARPITPFAAALAKKNAGGHRDSFY